MRDEIDPRMCIWEPHLGEGEVVGSHRSYHSKDRWWFPSYKLSIVIISLSLTIRLQFAIECL